MGGGSARFLLSLSLMSNSSPPPQKKDRTTLQEHLLLRSHSPTRAGSDYSKPPAAGGPRKYAVIDI